MSAPRDFLFMGQQPETFDRERIYDGSDDLIARITAAVRVADQRFESSGGSSRHWVRECLLPTLEEHRLVIVDQLVPIHRDSAERDVRSLADKLDASDHKTTDLLAALVEIELDVSSNENDPEQVLTNIGRITRAAIAKARGAK